MALVELLLLSIFTITSSSNDLEPVYIYVTNRTNIFRLEANSSTGLYNNDKAPDIIYSNRKGFIRALDIDEHNGHLYWADFGQNSINKSDLVGNDTQYLFKYAIGYVEGLAVDWSSNNLYWTDSLLKMVEVSRTDGKYRKVLFKLKEGTEPRGIFADPISGYLFWSDWGKTPKIERSSLSGDGRITLVSENIKWPNDLAVDHKYKILYWIDASTDKIESIDFDGNNRRVLVELKYHDRIVHPYSMGLVFQNNVTYIADWYTDSLYMYDQGSMSEDAQLVFKNSDRTRNIGQVRLTGYKDLNASKPCLIAKCSHLCLKSINDEHKCGCPTGMVANDSNNCIPNERDYEIYFADSSRKAIFHITKYKNQEGVTIRPFDLPGNETFESPTALAFYEKDRSIFWTDGKTKKLYRMHENEINFTVVKESETMSPEVLAIDQISSLIYYFDKELGAIIMSSIDGEYHKTILDGLHDVYDIALYEEKGYIYYTDYDNNIIGRVNTDGSNSIHYHSDTYPAHATSLAIDKIENRVYLCDKRLYKMESTDLDFNNKRLLIQKTILQDGWFYLIRGSGYVITPTNMAILHGKVYWADSYKGAIFEADKRFGGPVEYVTGGLEDPKELHVFTNQVKEEKKILYQFSFDKDDGKARCYFEMKICMNAFVSSPKQCPPGFKEGRKVSTCGNSSETLGANHVLPCENWHSCAQRTYGGIKGCRDRASLIRYSARECIQNIKVGYCAYNQACPENPVSCISDDDCSGVNKCCKTSCGNKCTAPLAKYDHPCTINNGGCSHFCLTSNDGFICTCPEKMELLDNKKCVPYEDICRLSKVANKCSGKNTTEKYFFNSNSKQCEKYDGCPGDGNKFLKEDECSKICTGVCPKITHATSCEVTNNTCDTDDDCPSTRLCCSDDCGKSCLLPEPHIYCAEDTCQRRGKCTSKYSKDFYCTCRTTTPYYIGRTCSLDLRKGAVTASFSKKGQKKVDYVSFTKDLAKRYTDYCLLNECIYVDESNRADEKRKRRESPEAVIFTYKDIYVDDYRENKYVVKVEYTIVKPPIQGNARMGYLSKSSSETGLKVFGKQFAKSYGLKYEDSKKKSGVSKGVIAFLVLLLVAIALALVVVVLLYVKKKGIFSRPKKGSRGHVTFENQLYDDLHPTAEATVSSDRDNDQNVIVDTSPQEKEMNILPVSNPAVADASKSNDPPEIDSKDWVQFDENNGEENDINLKEKSNIIDTGDTGSFQNVPQKWEKFEEVEEPSLKDLDISYDFADPYEMGLDERPDSQHSATQNTEDNDNENNHESAGTFIPNIGHSDS